MEFSIHSLYPVVINLIKQENRTLAFKLLEYYYPKAKTLDDFDTIGTLALRAEHREMYLQCAEHAYSIALSTTPNQIYTARKNLYKAYTVLNYPNQALFYIELNLKIDPNDFDANRHKAFNIALTGDKILAETLLLDLIDTHPDKSSNMSYVLAGKLLREGDTAQGILRFVNASKPTNKLFTEALKMTQWTGNIIPGQIIYIDGEGGIGDEIINIRFFKYLTDLGMQPILYSAWSTYRMDLVDLFRRHGFTVITDTYSIDKTQTWVPMMALPAYLKLEESDLWYGPYLTALRHPKNKLTGTKFKIGIKCSGNPYYQQDEHRKIPIELLLDYLPKDAEVYYIDKEVGHPGAIDLGYSIENWDDTLDFIDQMDCIVSSCTSLVHAAGALGKTTFVAVPIAEYYTWTSTRTDTSTPWYGKNFHVFKQTEVRNWHKPLYTIQQKLQELISKQ
jgi:hypothetical protein